MRRFLRYYLFLLPVGFQAQVTPSFAIFPLSGSQVITCGSAGLSFSVTPSNAASTAVCWWHGPFSAQGFSATLSMPGVYTVQLVSGTISVTQTLALQDGRVYPVLTPAQDPSILPCPEGTATLSISASGVGPMHYAWYAENSPSPAGNASTLAVAAAGQYKVVVADLSNGCASARGLSVWACVAAEAHADLKKGFIVPNPVSRSFCLNSPIQAQCLLLTEASGKKLKAWTGMEGDFEVTDLPDGAYWLWIDCVGFSGPLRLVKHQE